MIILVAILLIVAFSLGVAVGVVVLASKVCSAFG